ncbi:tetratricopeptide repeat protein [Vibrio sp. 1F255]|uniref:tetratricopeptide repeat protein n=1 Tax=Vibrio sp. 1F255 TaxID=3230009 RepID=UPI00352D6E03
MYKIVIVIILSYFVFGCANSSLDSKLSESKESILIETNNYPKLIAYYKGQLKIKESDSTRIKLAEAYANNGDYESSLFVITRVREKDSNVKAIVVECNALFEIGNIRKAELCLLRANELDKNNPEIENQLGITYAYLGYIKKSKYYFERSREHFVDDVKIKNNLAMVSMLEGDFEHAASLLLPIYIKGASNEKIETNLVFSLVKINQIDSAKKILASRYSEKESFQIINDIKSSQSVNSPII